MRSLEALNRQLEQALEEARAQAQAHAHAQGQGQSQAQGQGQGQDQGRRDEASNKRKLTEPASSSASLDRCDAVLGLYDCMMGPGRCMVVYGT